MQREVSSRIARVSPRETDLARFEADPSRGGFAPAPLLPLETELAHVELDPWAEEAFRSAACAPWKAVPQNPNASASAVHQGLEEVPGGSLDSGSDLASRPFRARRSEPIVPAARRNVAVTAAGIRRNLSSFIRSTTIRIPPAGGDESGSGSSCGRSFQLTGLAVFCLTLYVTFAGRT